MLLAFMVLYEHLELHDSGYSSDNSVCCAANHVSLNGQPENVKQAFFCGK
jgi:hypothetical protein